MKTKNKSVNKIGTDSDNFDEIHGTTIKNTTIANKINQDNLQNILSEPDESEIDKIKEVIPKSQNLKIEIISSTTEPKGSILIINPLGLENGKRKSNDEYHILVMKKIQIIQQ